MNLKGISADPSGVERVGQNENANYPIPTTKYQCQLPDTQYPNILMPNTENIKMPKYPMIQNIKLQNNISIKFVENSDSFLRGKTVMSTIEQLRLRQVHLDFHTAGMVENIGLDFDPEEFAQTLEDAGVDSITCFARCHHGYLYYPSKLMPERIHPNLKRPNLLGEQIFYITLSKHL